MKSPCLMPQTVTDLYESQTSTHSDVTALGFPHEQMRREKSPLLLSVAPTPREEKFQTCYVCKFAE